MISLKSTLNSGNVPRQIDALTARLLGSKSASDGITRNEELQDRLCRDAVPRTTGRPLQTSGLIEMRSDIPLHSHNRQRIQEETRWSLASQQAHVFNLKMDIFLDDIYAAFGPLFS